MFARKSREILRARVALDGDRLIASEPTVRKVYSKAKTEGIEIPFVELVTERESMPLPEDGFREQNYRVRQESVLQAQESASRQILRAGTRVR